MGVFPFAFLLFTFDFYYFGYFALPENLKK